MGMPISGEEMEVHVQCKGNGAVIRFVAQDTLAIDMEGMPVITKIEYEKGYAVFGMPNAYAMRMLIAEFHALAPRWRFLPTPCYMRDFQGWAIHETLKSWSPGDDFSDNDQILILLLRIQEGAARESSYLRSVRGLLGSSPSFVPLVYRNPCINIALVCSLR
jgi:hypothetical protein